MLSCCSGCKTCTVNQQEGAVVSDAAPKLSVRAMKQGETSNSGEKRVVLVEAYDVKTFW